MKNFDNKNTVVGFPGHSKDVFLCSGCAVVRVDKRGGICTRCVPIVLAEAGRRERKQKARQARRFWIAFFCVGAVIALLAASGAFRGELPW